MFRGAERAFDVDEVDVPRGDRAQSGMQGFERGAQFGDAEIGNCEGAGELEHGGGAFYWGQS